jgi:hypothetical protein
VWSSFIYLGLSGLLLEAVKLRGKVGEVKQRSPVKLNLKVKVFGSRRSK